MPARKLNILFFIDHIDGPGGTERHLSYLATMLDRERFHCTIIVFDLIPNTLVDWIRAQGIEVLHIPVARYYGPDALRKAFTVARVIRERKADIVQTYHYKSDVYATLIARLCGVRHIITSKRDVAAFKKPFHFRMHRLMRPLVERYIVVSQMVWDVVVRQEGADPRKLVKIFNGVNLEGFSVPTPAEKAAAREKLGLGAADVVIGIVAWMRPEKDHQLLLGALQQLRARGLPAKLVVVGPGPLLEPSKQWVREQGIEDSVIFAGHQENVRPMLAAFDIACLVPKENEGFSNSVLEKMAVGLPLVVTDIGGNREAVETGVNGYVIPPGARDALVEHLARLCADPPLRARMGAASRERVERLFSLGHMIERHEQLYLSLAGGSGHG